MSDRETVAFYDRAAAKAGNLSADGPPDAFLRRFIDALPACCNVLESPRAMCCACRVVTATFAGLGLKLALEQL